MIYGLSTRVFSENGPVAHAADAKKLRSTAKAWRALDEARRLALVEHVLDPANDIIDGFPLAL